MGRQTKYPRTCQVGDGRERFGVSSTSPEAPVRHDLSPEDMVPVHGSNHIPSMRVNIPRARGRSWGVSRGFSYVTHINVWARGLPSICLTGPHGRLESERSTRMSCNATMALSQRPRFEI